MVRTYVPEVNHHVTYFDATCRARAATITAVGSTNGGLILRIGRGGGTVGNASVGILRTPFNHSATKANTWSPY